MTQNNSFAADYIPVNERIQAFHEKYPEGSLQSEILTLNDHEVLIRAQAFRTPDDPRPGIGHARETIPGATPYTRGSEVENAETSAWGRAIAALGFEVKSGIATAEDVRNAQARQNGPQRPAAPRPVTQPTPARTEPPRATTAPVQNIQPMGTQQALDALAEKGFNRKTISDAGKALFGTGYMKDLDGHQRAQLVAHLIGGGSAVPAEPSPSSPADDENWGALFDQAPAA